MNSDSALGHHGSAGTLSAPAVVDVPAGPGKVYAEDLLVGEPMELGSMVLSRDEVIAFGRAWDPQSFHIDENSEGAAVFGGVIASALQSLCVIQRLATDALFHRWAMVAGKGMTDVRMLRPVRPGVELRGVLTVERVVLGTRRATIVTVCELYADGELAMSYRGEGRIWKRPVT